MEDLYPRGPKSVPDNLTEPSTKYRKHIWVAVGGILLFVVLYCGLTWWFIHKAYEFIQAMIDGTNSGLVAFIFAFINSFLALFMVKALFFRIQSDNSHQHEITREQEPVLFSFIDQLVKDSGAPSPHKVYLSDHVNAAVFYNLSIFNLLFPSRKNLVIGLGLVNVLNIGEFKAVLAHEFGHFGQRSMLVGRWVYVAHQIASYIIAKRDFLDKFLGFISAIDIRISWIGWILQLIVWSIRAVVETAFRLVVMAERRLSQEMEFHADSVAVSLTGSDALIHALHRLGSGDRGYTAAMEELNRQLGEKAKAPDVFDLQTHAIEQLARVYNQPDWMHSPVVPEKDPQKYRVFKSRMAQPPKMWATHPADFDRENEAKKMYIPAAIDDRSAWELFKDAEALRLKVTDHLYREVTDELTLLSREEAITQLNEQYVRRYFESRYRGIYRGYPLFRRFESLEDCFDTALHTTDLKTSLESLYPESLGEHIENRAELFEEKNMLEGIQMNNLSTTGTQIMHRGEPIKRKELPQAIEEVQQDIDQEENKIDKHTKLCLATYRALGKQIGQGWDAYVEGLIGLMHYAEHTQRDLGDAMQKLGNVVAVVTADDRVTDSEMADLLRACHDVQLILTQIFLKKEKIKPDQRVLKRLKLEKWDDRLEEFALGNPTGENINGWLQVIDGWSGVASGAMSDLKFAALEELLETVDYLNQVMDQKQAAQVAPNASTNTLEYRTLIPGKERKIQTQLGWWDRLYTADGTTATLLRLAAASVIIGGTISLGAMFDKQELVIYNGFSETVRVELEGSEYYVYPHSTVRTEFDAKSTEPIAAYMNEEQIEEFIPDPEGHFDFYVYNVGRAAALYEYRVWYGNNYAGANNDAPTPLGSARFSARSSDYIMEEPPSSIKIRGAGETRSVYAALSDMDPSTITQFMESRTDRNALISAHCIWEPEGSPRISEWLASARTFGNLDSLVRLRLARFPNEIESYRMLMDNLEGNPKDSLCQKIAERLAAEPNDANWNYLSCRCMDETPAKNKAFITGYEKFPNNRWFNYAAGYSYTDNKDWLQAHTTMNNLCEQHPEMAKDAALSAERMYRIIRLQQPALKLERHHCQSDYLSQVKTMELEMKGKAFKESPSALGMLKRGALSKTLKLLKPGEDDYYTTYRLVGASDGATKEQIRYALDLRSKEGLNLYTVWASWGLALREKVNTQELEQYVQSEYKERSSNILKAVKAIEKGQFTEADEWLKNTVPFTRFEVYSLARVLYGNRIPKDWQQCIEAGLFTHEKPYFAPLQSS